MARMTRTQISLEDRQREFLKARATESGCSLSAVLREIIDREIADRAVGGPSLMALAGSWEGGGVAGAHHDRVLAEYMARRKGGRGG